MERLVRLGTSVLIVWLLFSAGVPRATEPIPLDVKDIGIEPQLGKTIPLNLAFTNEDGRPVVLGQYFNQGKPVILTLVYYECPMLCTFVLNGLKDGMKTLDLLPGKDFTILTISIHPGETTPLAVSKRDSYLTALGVLAVQGLGRLSGLGVWRGRTALPSAMAWVLILALTTPTRRAFAWPARGQLLLIATLAAMLLVTLVALVRRPDAEPGARPAGGVGEWRDYLRMTKPGLNGLVLVTTLMGFQVAARGSLDWPRALCTMLGTGLVAAGASVLNQVIERRPDALMARTALRPLPTGRLAPRQATVFGAGLALAGLALLLFTVNLLTAYLAALSFALYLFVYTPLKRINTLSTLAGAVSGAMPPLLGWTGAVACLYGATLLPISLMPTFQGITGGLYLAGASVLGFGFLTCCLVFAWRPGQGSARRLFFASIAYLPLLLMLMAVNKDGPG